MHLFASLTLVGSLLGANQDPAGTPSGLGIAPVGGQDQAPPELLAGVDEHVRAGLARFGAVDVTPGAGCEQGSCMAEAAGGAGAAVVVRVSVTAEARDYILRTQLISGRTGEVLRADESYCEICTYDEVLERLDQELGNLGAPIDEALAAAELPAKAKLHVVSEPPDAVVRIDGAVVGNTPLEIEVDPGVHEVSVSREGFSSASESIDLGAEEERALELSLTRERAGGVRLKQVLGWAGVGVGVLGVGTGIGLLIVDENPYKPSCDGLAGTCARRYNTLGGGIAALAVGVVAAGAGATLLILDKRERGKVEAWIGPGGAGLRGRF